MNDILKRRIKLKKIIEDNSSNLFYDLKKKYKANIKLEEGKITIEHKYDQELVDQYRLQKKFYYNRSIEKWVLDELQTLEECYFLLNLNQYTHYNWKIQTKALNYIQSFINERTQALTISKELYKIKNANNYDLEWQEYLKNEPYPYQKVGIKFLDLIDGVGMIGDDMGLGKTLQALGYTSWKKLKTLIVCPNSLKYNWKDEIGKHTYRNSIVLSEIDPKKLDRAKMKELRQDPDYIIINYKQIKKYDKYINRLKFDCIILDESHKVKESKTEAWKKLKKYKKLKHKILLSGTPIKNRPIEFYTQFHFLKPELFQTKEQFGFRYCDAQKNDFGETNYSYNFNGASNLRELYFKMEKFYIRRLKKDVLKDLPPKIINLRKISLSKGEQQHYQFIKNQLKPKVTAGSINKKQLLAEAMILKQFLSITKINYVKDIIKHMEEENPFGKIVIFSQFTETQKQLINIYKNKVNYLIAEDNAQKRFDNIKEFQSNPDKNIFVAATLAGSEGLNLTKADSLIFMDRLWEPASHRQAEDRIHRIGQEKPVNIYYLDVEDSIDEKMAEMMDDKAKLLDKILDGKFDGLNLSIKDEFLDFFIKDLKK